MSLIVFDDARLFSNVWLRRTWRRKKKTMAKFAAWSQGHFLPTLSFETEVKGSGAVKGVELDSAMAVQLMIVTLIWSISFKQDLSHSSSSLVWSESLWSNTTPAISSILLSPQGQIWYPLGKCGCRRAAGGTSCILPACVYLAVCTQCSSHVIFHRLAHGAFHLRHN